MQSENEKNRTVSAGCDLSAGEDDCRIRAEEQGVGAEPRAGICARGENSRGLRRKESGEGIAKSRGRPRAYKRKYADMAREFFEHPFFDEIQEVWYFPTVFRLAKKLGVSRKTLYNWMEEYPEFAEAIEDGNENAREMRIAFASCGKIDPKFAKFVLSADFGMRENAGVEIGNGADKPFEVNIRIVE